MSRRRTSGRMEGTSHATRLPKKPDGYAEVSERKAASWQRDRDKAEIAGILYDMAVAIVLENNDLDAATRDALLTRISSHMGPIVDDAGAKTRRLSIDRERRRAQRARTALG